MYFKSISVYVLWPEASLFTGNEETMSACDKLHPLKKWRPLVSTVVNSLTNTSQTFTAFVFVCFSCRSRLMSSPAAPTAASSFKMADLASAFLSSRFELRSFIFSSSRLVNVAFRLQCFLYVRFCQVKHKTLRYPASSSYCFWRTSAMRVSC